MADAPKERWLQWVALTTTILAVCAAISSLRASTYSTRVQLTTTKENNAWSYFQSKSIKQHSCEVERDLLQAMRSEAKEPATVSLLNEKLQAVESDIARYDREKNEIKVDADRYAPIQDEFKRHGGAFGLAVMLLQIAIMLSSVGALMKKRPLWIIGLIFGAGGLGYLGNGFFLWF